MTKAEALTNMMHIKNYLTQGNPIWDADVVDETMGMAMSALYKSIWVSCNERLPSESGYYLATVKSSFETEVAIIWFAHIDDYGSKSEWREITDDDTVLAWMPMPSPYEVKE